MRVESFFPLKPASIKIRFSPASMYTELPPLPLDKIENFKMGRTSLGKNAFTEILQVRR